MWAAEAGAGGGVVPGGPEWPGDASHTVERMLALVREQMGMPVAFISQFDGEQRIVREVSAAPGALAPLAGATDSLVDGYCKPLLEGRIPAIVRDAAADPVVSSLPATAAFGIRSYVGSPIVLADGSVYGTLCAYSPTPDPSLTDRDAKFVRSIARLVGERLDHDSREHLDREAARRRVRAALQAGDPTMVVQPIVDLRDRHVVGYEALARFSATPGRSPAQWFADAASGGVALELELEAARRALLLLPALDDAYLTINVSPPVLCSAQLAHLLTDVPPDRVVLELTEHDKVDDFRKTKSTVERFRARGIAIALDDVGAGYAGLTQILRLRPDIVKLDRGLIHAIARDAAQRSLVAAAVSFAAATGARLVAEGVQRESDLPILCQLGVTLAQGFALGRPGPLDLSPSNS